MSKVVQFLQSLSLATAPMSEADYAAAVAESGVGGALRDALLRRDVEGVGSLLGVRANVMAFILPAEDEPDTERPGADEPEEPKEGEHGVQDDVIAA